MSDWQRLTPPVRVIAKGQPGYAKVLTRTARGPRYLVLFEPSGERPYEQFVDVAECHDAPPTLFDGLEA